MRRTLVTGVVTLATVAWLAVPASAGEVALQISPHSGPPGTSIEVVDNSSVCGDGGGGSVTITLVPDRDGADSIASVEVTTQDEVPEFDTDLTVPADATPGAYLVEATCRWDDETFSYGPQSFTVLAPAATTTTTPAPTTTTTVAALGSTTTTTTTVAPVPVAPAATPVVASPALTG